MTDPFAELALPRTFELDPAALSAAHDRIGDSPAYTILADPVQRADALLMLLGGPAKTSWLGVPSDFEAALSAAQNDPVKLAALHDQRLNNILNLFRQLRSNDKGPVLLGRMRMIRAELNALAAIPTT